MGHIANSNAFRLGFNFRWLNTWVTKHSYTKQLLEDLFVFRFLKRFFSLYTPLPETLKTSLKDKLSGNDNIEINLFDEYDFILSNVNIHRGHILALNVYLIDTDLLIARHRYTLGRGHKHKDIFLPQKPAKYSKYKSIKHINKQSKLLKISKHKRYRKRVKKYLVKFLRRQNNLTVIKRPSFRKIKKKYFWRASKKTFYKPHGVSRAKKRALKQFRFYCYMRRNPHKNNIFQKKNYFQKNSNLQPKSYLLKKNDLQKN